MTEAEAVEAIKQRWIDAWPGLQPSVPYTFDNELYDAPATWARVSVLHTVREQTTSGPTNGRRFEARGQIFVQLFGEVNVGSKPLSLLADSVREVFESRRIGDEVVTYAGSTRESPTDGRWAMRVVTVPFFYDETR